MPKDIVDVFVNFWNFLKRFVRDLYTLLKFRGHEFDEKLQVKYPTTIRALIWLTIAIVSIGSVVFLLSVISDFTISKINLGVPTPTPTPVGQYQYR